MIDPDATLGTAHSEKDGAADTYKGGDGFHPMLAYLDQTGEALAGMLSPGNAGSADTPTRSRSPSGALCRSRPSRTRLWRSCWGSFGSY
jgi:hypothetical protein